MTDLRVLSTGYDSRYALPRFTTVIESATYLGGSWLDPFDPRIERLLSLVRTVEAEYDGTTPLTTVSQTVYGTTSAVWLILLFNGSVHPFELQRGPIRLADPTSLDDAIKTIFGTRNAGQTVVV